MIAKYFLILFTCLAFAACMQKKKPSVAFIPITSVLGSWQLCDIGRDNRQNKPVISQKQAAVQHELINYVLQKGVMISFFPDSICTMFVGDLAFRTAKWGYTDRQHAINIIDSGKLITVFIRHEIKNQKQVLDLVNNKYKTEERYESYATSLPDYRNDPFYPNNNLWRIPPTHSETNTELQKRLENYFLHILYILKSARDRNQQSVTFEYSPGIIQIYDGGIGVVDETDISPAWKKTFYNSDQAHVAYKMYQDYMLRTHFHGKGTGNWLIDDHMLLTNIYNDLRAGKFVDAKEDK